MRGGTVSTRGLARGTETPGHRQGRTSTCPCELGVDHSRVLIGPIVASEGNGGRLGNYADPTAARPAGRCAHFIGQRAQRTSRLYAFPRGQPRFVCSRPNGPDCARPRALLGLAGQLMATTTLVAPEYASPVAGTSNVWYDMRSQGPSIFGFDRLLRGRIYERPIGQHTRAGRKLRGIHLTAPHDVHDRNALGQKIVGNDAAVATPPYGFGTHDRAAIVTGERSQLVQSCSESVRCRVIGVVPESGNLPERIERSWRPFFPVPQSAKSR